MTGSRRRMLSRDTRSTIGTATRSARSTTLFVDGSDEPEYIGVEMGLFGLSGTTLVPWEICRRDEANGSIEVDAEKERVKDGPNFENDQDISPDFERQVREHYGLEGLEGSEDRGTYGTYYSDRDGDSDRDREETAGTNVDREGDEDELRVQRTEEELRAGTREREAGRINVRKRIRTDREQVKVPKKREEITVERVPVDEGSAAGAAGDAGATRTEISEDEEEIRVPVVEEEVRGR